jgi:hypothetical protein
MAPRQWIGKSAANQSGNPSGPRIAVVGTGVAALMCVRTLAKKVRNNTALQSARISFCTSRGKLATQMGPKNQTLPQPGKPFFDYGCQYFTATNPMFAEEVERWAHLGYVSALQEGQVGMISESEGFKPVTGAKCWVGNGGMGPMLSKLVEQTAKEFPDVVEHVCGFPDASMAVTGLSKDQEGWHLSLKSGKYLGPFDFVIGAFAQHVLTDPFLSSGGPACEKMLKCLRRVESNQLIPMQVSFEGTPFPANFCAAHVYGEPALGFISNNSQKPQQNGDVGTPGPMHWTLISTAEFAEREFNTNNRNYKRVAEQEMLAAFGRVLGIKSLSASRPYVNRLNHWEDGLPTTIPPNSKGCLFDVDNCLGWCGDFCVLPGIQGAALSGVAMSEVIEEFLNKEASKNFDTKGFLPCDDSWLPFSDTKAEDSTLMDIGAFSSQLDLKPLHTHTTYVPSAIDGYNKAAQTGDVGKGKGKGYNSESGKGKGKGKGKVSSKGKSKYY